MGNQKVNRRLVEAEMLWHEKNIVKDVLAHALTNLASFSSGICLFSSKFHASDGKISVF